MKSKLVSLLQDHQLVKNYGSSEKASDETRALFWETISRTFPDISSQDSGWLFLELFDELLGCGAIGPAMRDPSMRVIRVTAYNQVFVQNMAGHLHTGISYDSPAHLEQSLKKWASSLGLHLEENKPQYTFHAPNQWEISINLSPTETHPEILQVRAVLAN
jgi:Flp pilus assembly CpaF family ATPase